MERLGTFFQGFRGQQAGVQPYQLDHLQQGLQRVARFQIDIARFEQQLAATLCHLLQMFHQRFVIGDRWLQHHAKARLMQQHVRILWQQFGRQVEEGAIAADQTRQRAIGDGRQHAVQQALLVARFAVEHDFVGKQVALAIEHRRAQYRKGRGGLGGRPVVWRFVSGGLGRGGDGESFEVAHDRSSRSAQRQASGCPAVSGRVACGDARQGRGASSKGHAAASICERRLPCSAPERP